MSIEQDIEHLRGKLDETRKTVESRIVGQSKLLDEIFVCLLSGGHALLEGVPGLGKTYVINTVGRALDLATRRIQFTPDLMPADIIGTNVLAETESGANKVVFQAGPIFANIVLADEINRATPKTQSALLEAMQEASVTVAGNTHRLDAPFMVLATQNPLEMEGTYPLPEAQLDRFFFKLVVPYPGREDMMEILRRTTGEQPGAVAAAMDASQIEALRALVRRIPASEEVMNLAVRLVEATHPQSGSDMTKRFVRYGASPRGAQTLILAAKAFALIDGRIAAAFEDLRRAALPALRHRLILSFQGEAEGITSDDIIADILSSVPDLEG